MKDHLKILEKTWKIFFLTSLLIYSIIDYGKLFDGDKIKFFAEIYLGFIFTIFVYIIFLSVIKSLIAHGKNKFKEIIYMIFAIFLLGIFVKVLIISLNKINFFAFIISLVSLLIIDLSIYLITKNKSHENKEKVAD